MEEHQYYIFQFISREITRNMRKKSVNQIGLDRWCTWLAYNMKRSYISLGNQKSIQTLSIWSAIYSCKYICSGFYVFSILAEGKTTSTPWKNLFPARIWNNLKNYHFKEKHRANKQNLAGSMYPVLFSSYIIQHYF